MNEEEKKAIEWIKNIITSIEESKMLFNEDITVILGTTAHNNLKEILNLIEKQQAEYSDLKLKYEQGLLLHKKHVSDLEIKDKMIEEMAKEILTLDRIRASYEQDRPRIWETEEGIKEYFRKKVEDNG